MLDLLYKMDNTMMAIGSRRLESLAYDIESDKCFTVYSLLRFQNMLNDNYQYCHLSLSKDQVLETINKKLNEE